MAGQGSTPNRHLSAVDAAFLYLERQEIPCNIGAVFTFDGAIPFDEFVESVDSKLHLAPHYRQIAVPSPWSLSHPTWEPDPHFDIRRHILRVRLPAPGGEKELENLAGEILGQLMDRGKPLWDAHVVEGLEEGRGAMILRIHHSLADGISGTAFLKVLLDPTPEGSRAIPKARTQPEGAPVRSQTLLEAVGGAARQSLENLFAAEGLLLAGAQAFLSGDLPGKVQSLWRWLPEFAASVERLPFNRLCAGGRKFCWTECNFADVQAVRAAGGGTVNDVILTTLTMAIARDVKMHGETVKKRFVRVVCPVNIRADKGETPGNRITFLPVALPLDARDPIRRLRDVTARTEMMKNARAAELVGLAANVLGSLPPPLQALFWNVIPAIPFPVPLLNIICTNLPGSPVPLYAAGRRMLALYPQVPTGHELGIGVAAQSYNGKLCFGFTADVQAAPDVGLLRDSVGAAFEELCRAAQLRKEASPKPKRRARRARPPKTAKPAPEPAAPVEEPLAMSAKPGA
ncbi:MAG: wax ester/triacylglycerol synthase family O-acyltransferase [Acidobacteria bacterium]|nr:wax ester/triacylglycerol synthase family O-acyltransferase [Acidobacteriota bacterium]